MIRRGFDGGIAYCVLQYGRPTPGTEMKRELYPRRPARQAHRLLYDVRAAAAIRRRAGGARLSRRRPERTAAAGRTPARQLEKAGEPSMSSPRLSRRHFTIACASAGLAACTSFGGPGRPDAGTQKPVRIGIALGGGAARGFAHIGVLKALEARGIPVELVAGTSAGSVVGALYASGMNALQINKLALEMDQTAISDWALPFRSRGLLQGVALQNFLNKSLNNRPIEKMAKPLGIVATDLQSGQPILFQQGNTGLAVRASCSVPSVFEPVRIGSREYVDGGLVSPVPASYARKMGANFVIAVDISARPDGAATNNPIEMLLQTFTIMGQTIKTYELEKYADVVIRPNLAAMGGSDFNQRNAAILAGEEAVARIMPELQRKLAAARTVPA